MTKERIIPKTPNIPETEKAYFAGFFDADGSVIINQSYNYCYANVYFRQQACDKSILDKIAAPFSTKVHIQKRGASLSFGSKDTIPFLSAVIPYLRIKRVEAQVALAFWLRYLTEDNREEFSGKCRECLFNLRKSERLLGDFDPTLETTYAYLAGYFDGDGSIMIRKSEYSFYPLISFVAGEGCSSQLEALSKLFGGRVREDGNNYRYRVESVGAYNFLSSISPYIYLKRQQAVLALEMREKFNSLPNNESRGALGKISKKQEIGLSCKESISELNQRRCIGIDASN